MKRLLTHVLFLAVVVWLLASCAASKKTVLPHPPAHTTAEVKRATVRIETGGNKFSVGCQLQTVFDSLCIVSLQPLSGMEMYALHATPDQLLVIDRMHQRYAITDYQTVNAVINPKIDFQQLQNMVSGVDLPQGVITLIRHFSAGKQEAEISITFPEIRYDQPLTTRPRKISNYQKTDIKTLLKNLL